jgi:hypothetical protein
MPAGWNDWGGDYQWRVRAYNCVVAPLNCRPRPQITGMSLDGGLLNITFGGFAHDPIYQASLDSSTDSFGRLFVRGYHVSTEALAEPVWQEFRELDFVSDRRAAEGAETYGLNPPWVPAGRNRPRPSLAFDETRQQYLLFSGKTDYQERYRIAGYRCMALLRPAEESWGTIVHPKVCEYDIYFTDRPEAMVMAPWAVKSNDGAWWLYASVIDQVGMAPRIVRASSPDGHQWSDLVDVTGLPGTSCWSPSVIWHEGLYRMFYIDTTQGQVRGATSSDGVAWTPVAGGAEVLAEPAYSTVGVVKLPDGTIRLFYDTNQGIKSAPLNGDVFGPGQLELGSGDYDGSGQSRVPMAPCPFVDHYLGNPELHLLFTIERDGVNVPMLCRREDRQWTQGDDRSIYGDGIPDYAFGPAGPSHTVAISASANGIASAENTKVRLIFSAWTPQQWEFLRQSGWSQPTLGREEDVFSPWPWHYNTQIAYQPYMIGGG